MKNYPNLNSNKTFIKTDKTASSKFTTEIQWFYEAGEDLIGEKYRIAVQNREFNRDGLSSERRYCQGKEAHVK